MKMFAVIKTKGSDMELLLITDREERAYARLAEAKQKCPSSFPASYAVVHTESFELSSGGAAAVSADYEWDCLEKTVRTRLSETGADRERFPGEFEELVSSVTCAAFHDMQHYGVSEDCAVNDAMEEHTKKIEEITTEE